MAEQMLSFGSFLARLSPRVRERLLALGESFRHAEGETIFREGDPALHFFIVKTGRVAIDIHIPGKGRRSILTIGPGDVFSWCAVVEPRIETGTVRTVADSEIIGIKGGTLMDLCREDTEFGFEFYRAVAEVIAGRLTATRLQMLDVFALA